MSGEDFRIIGERSGKSMWEKIGEVVIVQAVIGDGVIVQPLYIWEGPVKLDLFY